MGEDFTSIELGSINNNNQEKIDDTPHTKENKIGFNGEENPFDRASLFSLATFAWVEKFAFHCFRNVLEQSHLYNLAQCDKSSTVSKKIQKEWQKELKKDKKKQYWKASIRAYGLYYCLGMLFYSVYCASLFVGPQLMSKLINHILLLRNNTNDDTLDENFGYYYALAIFGASMIGSFCNYQSNLISSRVGNWMRSGMVVDIYAKSLKLDTAARRQTSPGEIVNLMSNDAQRVSEMFIMLNNGIFAPFLMIACIVLIYREIGWPTFVGLGIMLIVAPTNAIVARKLLKIRLSIIKSSDRRLRLISEILQYIKIIKLYAWEDSFAQKVTDARNSEIKSLSKFSNVKAGLIFIVTSVPNIISMVVFAIVFQAQTGVSADRVFSAMAYLNILRWPLNILPLIFAMLAQVKVSKNRVAKFLLLSERKPVETIIDPSVENGVYANEASFNWEVSKDDSFKLENISIQCKGSSLTMVVGCVGSGKSSICQAILGDMELIKGSLKIKGKIAYVPQQAFIINSTLKENILFGKEYDQVRYDYVIESCALKRDLEMFPEGDQVEIGERGINLSGGQKQRISIARAVYSDADIYILDDPLSAVDAHVGKHLFQKVITGALKNKTVILVANQLNYIPFANEVLVLDENKILERGTYKELMESQGEFSKTLKLFGIHDCDSSDSSSNSTVMEDSDDGIPEEEEEDDDNQIREDKEEEEQKETIVDDLGVTVVLSQKKKMKERFKSLRKRATKYKSKRKQTGPPPMASKELVKVEERETGAVNLGVYYSYFKNGGIGLFGFIIFIFILETTTTVLISWWLSVWSNTMQFGNGSISLISDQYLYVYIGIGVAAVIVCCLRNFFFFSFSVTCAKRIHENLFAAILKCPMSFFDTTPMGRILNRFSRDQDVLDQMIASSTSQYILYSTQIVATIVIISVITPFLLVPIAPIIVLYYFIQTYYRCSSRELQRLVSISRSPIFSHFSESLQGVTSIHAYGREQDNIMTNYHLLDENNKPTMMLQTINQWLGLRLDFLGNLIIFFTVIFVTINRDSLTIASIGLSISYSLSITSSLNRATLQGTDLETKMNSVERMNHYINGPTEAPQIIKHSRPSKKWPEQGGITMDNVVMSYRQGLEPVLKGISCSIAPNEKIGIVGRTGSGKSSLVLALFRLIELSKGSIKFDGLDISQVGLKDLRKNLAVLPQEACLFAGTLRMNLDPFNECDDEGLWRIVKDIQLYDKVKELEGGLDCAVSENGDNWSVGQRQLICLGRILLRHPKILAIDEGTASVDATYDAWIQQTIKDKFKDCTIITIAHRLNTIIDYDRIIVMDAGKIIEFDTPHRLLSNPHGLFTWLVDETGPSNSQQLKKLANTIHQNKQLN
ncbi:hypothetical protein DFA_06227 [Cavenderia fasciculata]|uniref:ABC transporter C family protein n=1 Tax=Cavenderia fasciculata TaxID=261658 RepID=F4PKG4_CACFS|nr:uncharacterized protein DFA_06227 [Cavenderia fasciculata]EGG24088.1 hypothetical protein DFA_06227 [Cavenderia fasciculata]|eukprot:XP_004361939.1 hypothetical protein DFA_06227 [Cavenderia fasciculata]